MAIYRYTTCPLSCFSAIDGHFIRSTRTFMPSSNRTKRSGSSIRKQVIHAGGSEGKFERWAMMTQITTLYKAGKHVAAQNMLNSALSSYNRRRGLQPSASTLSTVDIDSPKLDSYPQVFTCLVSVYLMSGWLDNCTRAQDVQALSL